MLRLSDGPVTLALMPSPMMAVNEPSTAHRTVDPRQAVEVWVDDGDRKGWFFGELREWAHYEARGWTATVTYSTGPSQNRLARFLAEHVREYEQA